jgi:1-deoxy-D-xylulose-5-phosphate synthase
MLSGDPQLRAPNPVFDMRQPLAILDPINSPRDLRLINARQLHQVAEEPRAETISAVAITGGHLGTSLGVVEHTVALHYVFATPNGKLIWNADHQAYPHKIPTGWRERMRTLPIDHGAPAATYAKVGLDTNVILAKVFEVFGSEVAARRPNQIATPAMTLHGIRSDECFTTSTSMNGGAA